MAYGRWGQARGKSPKDKQVAPGASVRWSWWIFRATMSVGRSCPGARWLPVPLQRRLQSDPSAKGMRSRGWLEELMLSALPSLGLSAGLNLLSPLASTGGHEKGQEPWPG